MDDIAQAYAYYEAARSNGNPTPVAMQREWQGKVISWGEPPIGWCSEPDTGAPAAPGSSWVQIFDAAGRRVHCRIR